MTPTQRHPESGQADPYAAIGAAAPAPASALRARVLRGVGFVPAFVFLVAILLPPLNHDVAAVLDFSRRWLAGERLYVDLVDVNPPLTFILNLVPAALARWTPLAPAQAMLLCLLSFAALVWRMADGLRRRDAEGPVEAAVTTACLPLLLVMAGSDFGQRDVLMGMAAIPYCLLAARRIEGPPAPGRLAMATVAVAALAFALKPYFLVVPLAVEALVLLRRGPARALRDPVPWLMAGIWLAYLLAVLAWFPAYGRQVLPFAWAVYGDIHGPGPWGVLVTDMLGAAAFLLLLALPLALRRDAGAFVQAMAVAACGAFASAWMQHKGWPYHVMPVTILGCGAAAVAAARWADGALPEVRARAAAPALAAVAAFAVLLYAVRGGEAPWREAAYQQEPGGQIAAWLRQNAHGADVLALSPDIYPLQPALTYAEARQRLHAMSTWPLQGAYRHCPAGDEPYRPPEEMGRAEALFFRRTADDFAAQPPRVLVVTRDARIPACGGRFDLLEYFLGDPAFAHAFRHFHLAAEIDGHRFYLRQY
jgi:hypothetical protein